MFWDRFSPYISNKICRKPIAKRLKINIFNIIKKKFYVDNFSSFYCIFLLDSVFRFFSKITFFPKNVINAQFYPWCDCIFSPLLFRVCQVLNILKWFLYFSAVVVVVSQEGELNRGDQTHVMQSFHDGYENFFWDEHASFYPAY